MFYVELNPGEDADEEDVISQSIKEIHQVATYVKRKLEKNLKFQKIHFKTVLKSRGGWQMHCNKSFLPRVHRN